MQKKKKRTHGDPYLLGKLLPCFDVEVSSQTSKKTNYKLTSLCHSIEMRQTIEHCTHQTRLHYKVILMKGEKKRGGYTNLYHTHENIAAETSSTHYLFEDQVQTSLEMVSQPVF